MLSDGQEHPFFLGMGYAGAEVPNSNNQPETDLILPDSIDRPQPKLKQELGFHAAKKWIIQTDHQRQYFGIRAQSD